MNEMKALDIGTLAARQILTGVSGGERALTRLADELVKHNPETPVVLDFHAVEVLGGSALRHLLQGIRRHPQCDHAAVVLANLSEVNQEEAALVAEATRLPYISAKYSADELSDAELRGPLDPKVARTLQLVIQAGEADAQTVSQLSNEPGVVTAWNNRLVTLQSMGLLRERKAGKRKFYSPVIRGLAYGG
jgi:hypothetical protein